MLINKCLFLIANVDVALISKCPDLKLKSLTDIRIFNLVYSFISAIVTSFLCMCVHNIKWTLFQFQHQTIDIFNIIMLWNLADMFVVPLLLLLELFQYSLDLLLIFHRLRVKILFCLWCAWTVIRLFKSYVVGHIGWMQPGKNGTI